ncbi:MAG: hypothetical protein ACRDY1_13965 [Acidimicrobiales bacterium]
MPRSSWSIPPKRRNVTPASARAATVAPMSFTAQPGAVYGATTASSTRLTRTVVPWVSTTVAT